MERLNLQQGSPDWLKWRQGGIGASDCPIILGLDPWKDPFRLWMEKTGRIKPRRTNAAQQHGHDNEDRARQLYVERTGQQIEPACFINEEFGFPMLASLDGWPLVEIKCPKNPLDHFRCKRERVIPEHYRIQMQHQLAVTGVGHGYYASFFEGELEVVAVIRDMPLIERIVAAEREFWDWVTYSSYPLPSGEEDRSGDERLEMLMRRVNESDQMLREAEERKREALAELRRELTAEKTTAGRFIASYLHKKGYQERYPRSVAESLSLTVRERRA